jgi:hypothetical protein
MSIFFPRCEEAARALGYGETDGPSIQVKVVLQFYKHHYLLGSLADTDPVWIWINF